MSVTSPDATGVLHPGRIRMPLGHLTPASWGHLPLAGERVCGRRTVYLCDSAHTRGR